MKKKSIKTNKKMKPHPIKTNPFRNLMKATNF